jgi:hypothetical protein
MFAAEIRGNWFEAKRRLQDRDADKQTGAAALVEWCVRLAA